MTYASSTQNLTRYRIWHMNIEEWKEEMDPTISHHRDQEPEALIALEATRRALGDCVRSREP